MKIKSKPTNSKTRKKRRVCWPCSISFKTTTKSRCK